MSTTDSGITGQPIRILVVEDNLVVQQYIRAALQVNPDKQVLEVVSDGLVAVEKANELRPDVMLLDLFLSGIDGIDVIQRVMNQCPCPIIVISGELERKDRDLTFEAQRAGAVAVLAKPQGMEASDFERFSQGLCHTIKLMSQVKVVRRWFDQPRARPAQPPVMQSVVNIHCGLLLIGSSTGGPAALYKILESLAPDFPFSVLIAQHIAAGFVETLCSWLGKTGCKVQLAAHGEKMLPGHVYLAPDERHLELGADGCLQLVANPQARFTPSVDSLFTSVAQHYRGKVCALILTGMGDDGTRGMARLFEQGALTIAEAESSCVIFGMPKMAINAGVVRAILPLDEICQTLKESCHVVS